MVMNPPVISIIAVIRCSVPFYSLGPLCPLWLLHLSS
jgi:hypothetical protein